MNFLGDRLIRQMRSALRMIVLRPSFSLAVILVLALGIGGTTASFAVFYRVMLRPLTSTSGDRLMVIGGAAAPPQGDRLNWWRQNHTFEDLATYEAGGLIIASSPPDRASAAVVSASFFRVFEASPILGRSFLVEEETLGRNRVAVLSYEFWHRVWSADRGALGKELLLDGIPYKIVGVMPAGFDFPGHTEVWIPRIVQGRGVRLDSANRSGIPVGLQSALVGLLRPTVTPTQAQADLNLLFHRLERSYARGAVSFGDGVTIRPLKTLLLRNARPALLALFAATLFLLLTACSNTAGMLLARAASQQKDVAIRLALGADSLEIATQFLAEAVTIALLAGAGGVCLAWWALMGIRNGGPSDIPALREVGLEPLALLFCLAVSVASAIFLSAVPTLAIVRRNLAEMMADAGSHAGEFIRRPVRCFFVAVQIVLAVVLTCGAGLMARSVLLLLRVDPGFDPAHVAVIPMEFNQLDTKTSTESSPVIKEVPAVDLPSSLAREAELTRRLLTEAKRFPAIAAIGLAADVPLAGTNPGYLYFDLANVPVGEAACFAVGGDYFRAMGIPIFSGRPFQDADSAAGSKVAIVNSTFVKMFLHRRKSGGDYLQLEGEQGSREIVGVVKDVRFAQLAGGTEPQIYLPYFQPFRDHTLPTHFAVVVRTANDPDLMLASLRARLASVDPSLVAFSPITMQSAVYGSLASQRFRAILLVVFAFFAIGLGMTGLYAVTAYSVSVRVREIGVRLAIGATPQDIRWMILAEGARLGVTSVVLGLALMAWVSRFISTLLFGVAPTDFATYLLAGGAILGAVLCGCLLPAIRASNIDPANALRHY